MTDLVEFTLADFLGECETNFHSSLSFAHTSQCTNLIEMLKSKKVDVTPCGVFKEEELAYFFLGRPAYKLKNVKNPKAWELPFVLLFENSCIVSHRRVFPFDSGAFANSIYPDYLSDFSIDGYNVSSIGGSIDLILDIFFQTENDYLMGTPKNTDEIRGGNKLDMRYQQVFALAELYEETSGIVDDRRLAIEVQTDKPVSLEDNLLGAVVPRPYLDTPSVKNAFKELKIKPRTYEVFPLDVNSYYALIYNEVVEIYKQLKVI